MLTLPATPPVHQGMHHNVVWPVGLIGLPRLPHLRLAPQGETSCCRIQEPCSAVAKKSQPFFLSRRIVDLGAYGLQIAIVVMHLNRAGLGSNALSVIMAVQVLLLWIKVQYYAR